MHIIYLCHLLRRYVPYVGDSKRAMDEYTSEIFMGGKVSSRKIEPSFVFLLFFSKCVIMVCILHFVFSVEYDRDA